MKTKGKNLFTRQVLLYSVTFALIFIFRLCCYWGQKLCFTTNDSGGYMSLDLGYFSKYFVSNTGQAPAYGFLLAVLKAIFGAEYYLYAVVALQILLSFASLFALAYVLHILGINRYLQCTVLLLYGASPAVCGWDGAILTESLSLSCTALFLFFVVRTIKMGGYGML